MIGVCLALLIDGSGSVPVPVFQQMVEAHASALTEPSILHQAETDGLAIRVITIEEWPRMDMGWTVLRTSQQIRAAANAIRIIERDPGPKATGTGSALKGVLDTIEEDIERMGCERTIIDVATDGQSNVGFSVPTMRDRAQELGVTINAVTVMTDRGADNPGDWSRENLITNDGFVVEANNWADWMRAIRRKLVMEVGSAPHIEISTP